jgi:hypothetical protein
VLRKKSPAGFPAGLLHRASGKAYLMKSIS